MSGEIYAKMAEMVGRIGVIHKDRTPETGARFNYRGIEDVYAAVNPIMAELGIFVTPEVLSEVRSERISNQGKTTGYTRLTVRYTFYASDGSSVSCVTMGEAMDSGDKATPKALSVAQKYAFFQTFVIPTYELADGDQNADPLPPASPPPPPPAQSRLDEAGMRKAFDVAQSMAALDEAAKRYSVPRDDPKRAIFAEAYNVRKSQLDFTGDGAPTSQGPGDTEQPATPAQIKALQAHYSKNTREERLDAVGFIIGRALSSFNALSKAEAHKALDAIKQEAA